MTIETGAGGTMFPAGAIGPAALVAGPLFMISVTLASLYLQLPQTITLSSGEVAMFAMLLGPAFIVGFLLSSLPILALAAMLHRASRHAPFLRTLRAWAAIGATIGTLLTHALDASFAASEIAFALVTTTITCAVLTQRRLYGGNPRPASASTLSTSLAGDA